MSIRRDRLGFTLIEVIVSLTIMAAIMAMVYGSYAATTRSMDASSKRAACEERACFALRLMARQIRCAYAPLSRTTSTHSTTSQASPDETTSIIDAPQALFRGDGQDPHGEILSFVTSGGTGAGPNAPRGLCRVTYQYDRTAATLAVRRADQDNRPAVGDSDTVLRNVTSIELKFHDGRQWQQTWDFRQRHALPRAVNVEITVADETGRPHHLATTVLVVEQVHESERARGAMAAGQL